MKAIIVKHSVKKRKYNIEIQRSVRMTCLTINQPKITTIASFHVTSPAQLLQSLRLWAHHYSGV